jgi:Leucine-rich repeat (LRR) protein
LFTGSIPSEIGRLQGVSVFVKLKDNNYYDSSKTAPLSLCLESEVEEFDLATDPNLCPIERNALSDFYNSTKGAEWTDSTNWLDEYTRYCDWKGVTCDDDKQHVTELELSNNGLSGRLRESIGNLTFIKVLDLSDNDIKVISVCSIHLISLTFTSSLALTKQRRHSRNSLISQGSIPAEIGKLSNLTYLRLSYNAFTGTAECLGGLTKLRLLQLQSNRITGMPIMTQLDMSKYNKSTLSQTAACPLLLKRLPSAKIVQCAVSSFLMLLNSHHLS